MLAMYTQKLKIFSSAVLCTLLFMATLAAVVSTRRYFIKKERIIIQAEKKPLNSDTFIANTLDPQKYESVASNQYAEDLLKELSTEEKIGQLFIWRAQGTQLTPEFSDLLKATHAGGVIVMGDNVSPELKNFTVNLQQQSPKTPLFIAIDQEGGIVKRISSDPNPGQPSLGRMEDGETCTIERNTATLLKNNGVNLNFGIVGDISWKADSYMSGRTFGFTSELVSNKVGKAIDCSSVIFNTVKHFPGHGRTSVNSHNAIPEISISYDDWLTSDAVPFKVATEKGIGFVMTGHLRMSSVDDKPASISQKNINNLRKLGFQGVVITDDMGMLTKSKIDPIYALDNAIDAGNDIMLYVDSPIPQKDLYNHVLGRAQRGEIKPERINDSVRRILKKKYQLALNK
jgi:beta-N-acetylhexosaminidase